MAAQHHETVTKKKKRKAKFVKSGLWQLFQFLIVGGWRWSEVPPARLHVPTFWVTKTLTCIDGRTYVLFQQWLLSWKTFTFSPVLMKPSKINLSGKQKHGFTATLICRRRTVFNLVFSAVNLSTEWNSAPTSSTGGILSVILLTGSLACASIKTLSLMQCQMTIFPPQLHLKSSTNTSIQPKDRASTLLFIGCCILNNGLSSVWYTWHSLKQIRSFSDLGVFFQSFYFYNKRKLGLLLWLISNLQHTTFHFGVLCPNKTLVSRPTSWRKLTKLLWWLFTNCSGLFSVERSRNPVWYLDYRCTVSGVYNGKILSCGVLLSVSRAWKPVCQWSGPFVMLHYGEFLWASGGCKSTINDGA